MNITIIHMIIIIIILIITIITIIRIKISIITIIIIILITILIIIISGSARRRPGSIYPFIHILRGPKPLCMFMHIYPFIFV